MTGSLTDPKCTYCGRPVLGASVFGYDGIYHPSCTQGPEAASKPLLYELPPTIGELSELRQRIERLERLLKG